MTTVAAPVAQKPNNNRSEYNMQLTQTERRKLTNELSGTARKTAPLTRAPATQKTDCYMINQTGIDFINHLRGDLVQIGNTCKIIIATEENISLCALELMNFVKTSTLPHMSGMILENNTYCITYHGSTHDNYTIMLSTTFRKELETYTPSSLICHLSTQQNEGPHDQCLICDSSRCSCEFGGSEFVDDQIISTVIQQTADRQTTTSNDKGLHVKKRCYEGDWLDITFKKTETIENILSDVPNYQSQGLIKKISDAKMTDLRKCYQHVSDPQALEFYRNLVERNSGSHGSELPDGDVVEPDDADDDDTLTELKNRTVSQIIKGYVSVDLSGDRMVTAQKRKRKENVDNKQRSRKKKKVDKTVIPSVKDVCDAPASARIVPEEEKEVAPVVEVVVTSQSIEESVVSEESMGRGKRLKKKTVKYE